MTQKEREIIRELAKQVKDRSELPEMEQRRAKWYEHNDLKSTEPVVAVFPEGAWHEILPSDQLLCEDAEAREMEWLLRARLFRSDVIKDDIPTERTWEVEKIITDTGWDSLNPEHRNSAFGNESKRDNNLGDVPVMWKKGFKFNEGAMHFDPIIEEPSDLKRLQSPKVTYHEKETLEKLKIHQEVLGDILHVQLTGKKFLYFAMMETYTDFRGLEQVMYDIYEEPEMLHEGMQIMLAGYQSLLDQYIEMDLLEVNNRQGYNGSGGMNYTHDLPKAPGGSKNLENFWGFCESQEFTMVGPEQHYDFVMQYEKQLADRFGLFSYGCCEPIENKLKYVMNFNNIRRISVSPWADIESCSEQIGQKTVYSWKPNPSYIVNNFHDKEFLEKYFKNMLTKTKDNCAEIILKDTVTCQNDPQRFGEYVTLLRQWIAETRS